MVHTFSTPAEARQFFARIPRGDSATMRLSKDGCFVFTPSCSALGHPSAELERARRVWAAA